MKPESIPLYKWGISFLCGVAVATVYEVSPGMALGIIAALIMMIYAGYESWQDSGESQT